MWYYNHYLAVISSFLKRGLKFQKNVPKLYIGGKELNMTSSTEQVHGSTEHKV